MAVLESCAPGTGRRLLLLLLLLLLFLLLLLLLLMLLFLLVVLLGGPTMAAAEAMSSVATSSRSTGSVSRSRRGDQAVDILVRHQLPSLEQPSRHDAHTSWPDELTEAE